MSPHYLLPAILYNAAMGCPDKVAVMINNQQVTYHDILKKSLAFAHTLKAKPCEKLSRVMILTGNSLTTIVAFWGALFAEMIPCIIDSESSESTLLHLTVSLEPVCVIRDNDLTEKGSDFDSENFYLQGTESDLAMILYTSGSTGFPKGVMLSHRNVLSALASIMDYLGLVNHDVILSVLPMHFDYGLYQMLLAFYAKATLLLEKNAFLPQVILHHIQQHHVTVLPCVPLLVQLLTIAQQQYPKNTISIRLITNTGEHLSYAHIQKLNQLFPAATLFSMFGLTECKRCSYVPPHQLSKKYQSIGIPIPNLSMWIENELGHVVEPGCEGELMISGPTVMLGYWKNDEETKKKIRVTTNGKRILMTGDRAVMDDEGYFYFRGRRDTILKLHGIKLNCHEHVQKIMCIRGVSRAYLFLNNVQDFNELIACIELENNFVPSDAFKKTLCAQFHASQQPRVFYFTPQFPILSNGKVNKHVLEKQALESWISLQ